MPCRAAKVTQAAITRAVRAAKESGASAVTIESEGFIRIALASIAPTKPVLIAAKYGCHGRIFSSAPKAVEARPTRLMRSRRIERFQALVHGANQSQAFSARSVLRSENSCPLENEPLRASGAPEKIRFY